MMGLGAPELLIIGVIVATIGALAGALLGLVAAIREFKRGLSR